jgi:hypothetical protein
MFQIKFVKKIKTHTLRSVFFFSENRSFNEKMLKNMLEPENPQVTKLYGACALHAR